MQPRRRRPPPPWERRSQHPQHPLGSARRRWPRAYDGGEPLPEEQVNRRYRREYEGERRSEERRHTQRSSVMEALRQTPVRNGLIGLAVAGAAAPIAVNRYQQALRNDASHERVYTQVARVAAPTESAVAKKWDTLETKRVEVADARETTIQENIAKYKEFGLTREMAEDIYDMAAEADVDPEIAYGLVRAESSFKNVATSRVGAVGLTQLMPKTAAWLQPGTTTSDLRDQETNLRIGFKYLKQLVEKYDGNEDLALTAYNRGPGTVDRVLKRGGNPDNGYAKFVRTGAVGSHRG